MRWLSPPFLFTSRDRNVISGCFLSPILLGTCAKISFLLSATRTTFKPAGASVQSVTGIWVVRISGDNAGCIISWGSVKIAGYPLHSPVSLLLILPCVTVCHHVSTGLYFLGYGWMTVKYGIDSRQELDTALLWTHPWYHLAFCLLIFRALSLTLSGPQNLISFISYERVELFLYFPIRLHGVVHI